MFVLIVLIIVPLPLQVPARIDPNGFYTAESKIYQLTEGGRYNTQNDVVAQQLQFLIEPIKNWKTTIELNYRSNYNFSHTDYQTVYAYDVII